MKITFNVEISKKDGFKENHLNCNGELELSVEELKSIISDESVDVKSEEPVEKIFTVVVCKSTIYKDEFIYAVKNNKSHNFSLISPSMFNKKELTLRMIKEEDFNTLANSAIVIYDTNVLDFVNGKKVKEI